MATLQEIESLTKNWADAQDALVATVQGLEDAVESLRRQYLPGLKKQVAIAAQRKAELKAAIEDSRDLFRRPKTAVFHGVQVGFEKGKEEVTIEDPELTISLIEKLFAETKDLYIKTKKSVKKLAVKALSEVERKAIGVTVGSPGDVVVIRSMDSQVKKYIDKLLKEKEEDDEEAVA